MSCFFVYPDPVEGLQKQGLVVYLKQNMLFMDMETLLHKKDQELLPNGRLHFYDPVDQAVYQATSHVIAKHPIPESIRHLFMRIKTANGFYMMVKKSDEPPKGCELVDPDAKLNAVFAKDNYRSVSYRA